MLTRVLNMFRVADLRNKILFTLSMLVIFRLGVAIPSPGVDTRRRPTPQPGRCRWRHRTVELLLRRRPVAVRHLRPGHLPYITASIIMQVLGVVIPRIEQWQNQGAVGQRKITQWTRYLTIAIAIIQATSFSFLFHTAAAGSA